MPDSSAITQSWKVIEAWLRENAPDVKRSLRPGATPKAIAELEAKIGTPLPDDVKASYRIHDGQKDDAPCGVFPSLGDDLGPEPAFRLLSVKEIARAWAMMKGLLDGGDFAGRKGKPKRGIRK